jgi:CubicO group peptidase (beta-lactamase class C family)
MLSWHALTPQRHGGCPRRRLNIVVALQQIANWDVQNAAAVVVKPVGRVESYGDLDHSFRLASVAKLLTAYAALVALEEGSIDLYDAAGPEGSTVRHLLSHAAGYGFESTSNVIVPPGKRRMYSNRGIEELAAYISSSTAMPFATYLAEAVFQPLGMTVTELRTSAAFGMWSTARDMARFAAELLEPSLISFDTLRSATTVHFPDLAGVMPGYGRHDPLPWGLGFEIKGEKQPHYAGQYTSPETFGHFGGSGTFLWVDPHKQLACVVLTDRDFGDWAIPIWSKLSDDVKDEYG